jgi:hypothetical protein
VAGILWDCGFGLYRWNGHRFVSFSSGDVPPYGSDVFAARGSAGAFLRSLPLSPGVSDRKPRRLWRSAS